jgi:hypothetical protein
VVLTLLPGKQAGETYPPAANSSTQSDC